MARTGVPVQSQSKSCLELFDSTARERSIGSGPAWTEVLARGYQSAPFPLSALTMLARLALIFILVPIVELALLIRIGQWVGLWPTLGLVVATGLTGAALARAQGLRTLVTFQREVAEGRLPGQPLLDGLAILVGGAFLLTPGLLTDVTGFVLLLPPSRRWLQRWFRARIESRIRAGQIRVGMWTSGAAPGVSGLEGLDPRNEVGGGASHS